MGGEYHIISSPVMVGGIPIVPLAKNISTLPSICVCVFIYIYIPLLVRYVPFYYIYVTHMLSGYNDND